jgi:hypothetical protein
VLRQQRPDLFWQELAEMPVDGKVAGQKFDWVLPFEPAEIRLVHEVGQKGLQALRQGSGNFMGNSKVLRLGLWFWRPRRPGDLALVGRHRKRRWLDSPSLRLGQPVTIPGAGKE